MCDCAVRRGTGVFAIGVPRSPRAKSRAAPPPLRVAPVSRSENGEIRGFDRPEPILISRGVKFPPDGGETP